MIIKTSIPGLADSLVIPLQNKVNELNKEIVDLNNDIIDINIEHQKQIDLINSEHTQEVNNLNADIINKNNIITEQNQIISNNNNTIEEQSDYIDKLLLDIDNQQLKIEELSKYATSFFYLTKDNYFQTDSISLKGDHPVLVINNDSDLAKLVLNNPKRIDIIIEADVLKYTILVIGSFRLKELSGNIILKGNLNDRLFTMGSGTSMGIDPKLYGYDYVLYTDNRDVDFTFNQNEIFNTNSFCVQGPNVTSFSTQYCTTNSSKLDLNTSYLPSLRSLNYGFTYCDKLTEIDISSWDLSKINNLSYAFSHCSELNYIKWNPNFKEPVNCDGMLDIYVISPDEGLKELNLGDLILSSGRNMLRGAKFLERIDGSIDISNISNFIISTDYLFGNNESPLTRRFLIKNIGYQKNHLSCYFLKQEYWGVNSDSITDAKQSLLDSLITYSYNRFNSGYDPMTITLSTNTKNVLTDNEIAQITAKGFTIA